MRHKAPNQWAVRTCVIFNPAARGEKARRFRRNLDEALAGCTLKLTAAAGDGRRLAAEAVQEGFDNIVAAGGDGTLNEVLNGLGDAPGGIERCRLGLLPLGTVNVFAREMGIPTRLEAAWKTILEGNETRIDLPLVEYPDGNRSSRRSYFAQLAGAGLDARAIELVQWQLKKKVGPLAYVLAGLSALTRPPSNVTVVNGSTEVQGQLVLIGNGRRYGGEFRVFPSADARDGLLDVCVFPRVNWFTLVWCGSRLLSLKTLPPGAVRRFRAASFSLLSAERTPFEVDGELVGPLPARFSVEPVRLRVLVPKSE
jgi:YegS/Rv2252/BmrU family lipid kinase